MRVTGHYNISGNFKADEMARNGSSILDTGALRKIMAFINEKKQIICTIVQKSGLPGVSSILSYHHHSSVKNCFVE